VSNHVPCGAAADVGAQHCGLAFSLYCRHYNAAASPARQPRGTCPLTGLALTSTCDYFVIISTS